MTPEFFEMIKTRLEPHLARQATNYRAPISVEEKLALTIRYLATGESYTSLSCQFRFRVMRTTIELPPETVRSGIHLCGSAQHTEKPVSRSTWWSAGWGG